MHFDGGNIVTIKKMDHVILVRGNHNCFQYRVTYLYLMGLYGTGTGSQINAFLVGSFSFEYRP